MNDGFGAYEQVSGPLFRAGQEDTPFAGWVNPTMFAGVPTSLLRTEIVVVSPVLTSPTSSMASGAPMGASTVTLTTAESVRP